MSTPSSDRSQETREALTRPVPFLSLGRVHEPLHEELMAALETVLRTNAFVLGPAVEAFEKAFALSCEVEHAVACSSGTSALHLLFAASEIGRGDEVLVPAMSFLASAAAVRAAGATPVFVDVDPVSHTMAPEGLTAALTPRTRAILAVHLYGHPAPMDEIGTFAQEHGLLVFEDAAQSHGARYRGRAVGGLGTAAAFSFYPGKNLGACGEGGAVTTNNPALAERLRSLRDWGQTRRYHHEREGFNYRMDGFQGACLGVKLPHLSAWNAARRSLADRYQKALRETTGLTLPETADGVEHVWHLYVVRHPQRDRIRQYLETRKIQTGLHYPVPLHLQPCYADRGYKKGDFPRAEALAEQCLSLPLFPGMTTQEQDYVIHNLIQCK